MGEKKIKIVKDLSKSKLIQDIEIFISFVNSYLYFIKDFNKIMALLILIFMIKSINGKVISNNANDEVISNNANGEVNSKKNESDNNSNNSSEKFRKKLIKLKY